MPVGNGTGPAGMGPMTGRAAGYCAGYSVPGYMNPYGGSPGYGFGNTAAWPPASYNPYMTYPYYPRRGFGMRGGYFGYGLGRGGGRGRGLRRW